MTIPRRTRPSRTGRRAAGVAFAAAVLIGACGYRTGPLVPEGVRTVAIPVFDNDTFRREIEVELTNAVATEFHARTDLRVVGDPGAADLVIHGRISSFEERVLAERGRSEVTEAAVVVRVVVVLENRAAGTRRTRTLDIREPYSELKGQSLASARAEAFENLAERIVYALEDDGPQTPDRKPS